MNTLSFDLLLHTNTKLSCRAAFVQLKEHEQAVLVAIKTLSVAGTRLLRARICRAVRIHWLASFPGRFPWGGERKRIMDLIPRAFNHVYVCTRKTVPRG